MVVEEIFMSDKQEDKQEKEQVSKKRKYEKPKITTEKLVAFGALCNGTSDGSGRKATTVNCNQRKINS